jgi:Domain of unknown function (DUF4386)
MMSPDRRAALAAGALFIIAGVAGLLAGAVEHPVLTGTGYLAKIAGNAGQVSAGGLLELLEAGTSAGIAIALYPVLRKRSEGLALGAVAVRTLEAAMYAVGGVITLSLLYLVRHHAAATAPGGAGIQAIGDALTGVHQSATLAGAYAYIAGALMYYTVFYRSRLVPRWLTGWGIAAEFPLFTACLLATFGRTPVTSYTLLVLPIAVQEYVLAAWLIFKGFTPGATKPGPRTGPVPAGTAHPTS